MRAGFVPAHVGKIEIRVRNNRPSAQTWSQIRSSAAPDKPSSYIRSAS